MTNLTDTGLLSGDLATLVLSKSPKLNKRPQPGTRITGKANISVIFDLKQGHPHLQRVTQSVPWQRLAQIALGKLNDTHLDAALRQALLEDGEVEDYTTRIEGKLQALLETTEREINGKLTGKTLVVSSQFSDVTIEEVD